ncbi:MAG: ABC transporter permease [Gemmataceae bacterium]
MRPLTSYSLTIIWRERNRYFPAVLAVAFSAVLIVAQFGMLLGMLGAASRPIDRAAAEIWVGTHPLPSLGFGHPVPETWRARLAADPDVAWTEPYIFGFGHWHKQDGGTELCYIMGSRLGPNALGSFHDLTPEMRTRLAEPGTVVVAARDRGTLGFDKGKGDIAEISGRRVRIVGLLPGLNSLAFPGVFCSLRTARLLLPAAGVPEQTTYFLARCRDSGSAAVVAERLSQQYPEMAVLTRAQFSQQTRWHWLTKAKAGMVLGFSAVLAVVVGTVVTSQILYAATAASLREYAALRALGIPRCWMGRLILAQSFWVGLAGVAIAIPATFAIKGFVYISNLEMVTPGWLLIVTVFLTFLTALLAGLAALRPLWRIDPISLLR